MGALKAGFFSHPCHGAAFAVQVKFEVGFFKFITRIAQGFFKSETLRRFGAGVFHRLQKCNRARLAGPLAGAQYGSTRIRLSKTQTVTAIAKMADGSFAQASSEVKVTIGGCGG